MQMTSPTTLDLDFPGSFSPLLSLMLAVEGPVGFLCLLNGLEMSDVIKRYTKIKVD